MRKSGQVGVKSFSPAFALCVTYLVFQAIFFSSEWRPDEYKAIEFFSRVFFSSELSVWSEIFLRCALFLFNFSLLSVLYSLGLVSKKTYIFSLIWPMTIFLFTKIYWEFYIFPLCLVRYDLQKKSELLFMLLLVGLFLIFKEGNLLVILLYRGILLSRKFGFKSMLPIGVAVFGFILSKLFDAGLLESVPVFGEQVQRFQWTREVVNPEYTIFETIGIFLTSLHFFTLHTSLWWIDTLFTIFVILAIVSSKYFMPNFRKVRFEFFSAVVVIFTMTEMTHAFQNARYYFFMVPILAAVTDVKRFPLLALLGLFHVAFKVSEVLI